MQIDDVVEFVITLEDDRELSGSGTSVKINESIYEATTYLIRFATVEPDGTVWNALVYESEIL
jgi:hypothetical protein